MEEKKKKKGYSVYVTPKSYAALKQLKSETDVTYRRLIERSLELFQEKRNLEKEKLSRV